MAIATGTAIAIGAGAIGLGAIGGVISGNRQADAQENIARDQNAIAQQVLAQQKEDRERALGISGATMEELRLINRQSELAEMALQAQLGSIAEDEKLLHSVDPALKEAGVQAYQLLQGKEAAALAPLRNERSRQRDQLTSTLREQLGSGYETSTAGSNALAAFDRESAGLSAQVQQNTLGSFLGISASVRPDVSGKLNRAYGTASQMLSSATAATQNIGARRVAAFNGSPVNYQNIINTAGAGYVGELGRAQTMGNLFGNIGQLGGMMAGYGLQNSMLDKYGGRVGVNGNIPGLNAPAVQIPQTYNSPYFGAIGGNS